MEIVEIIIAYLLYETISLLACALTCYSWHLATIPHFYHTLIIITYNIRTDKKSMWPEPLQNMRKSGLLPLVENFQVHGEPSYRVDGFSSRLEYPQVHAMGSVVLWSLLADGPVPRPERTQRVLSPDHILHPTIPTPGRLQAPLRLV